MRFSPESRFIEVFEIYLCPGGVNMQYLLQTQFSQPGEDWSRNSAAEQ